MSRDCGKMWKHQWGWKYQEGSGFGRVMEGLWKGYGGGYGKGGDGVMKGWRGQFVGNKFPTE